jgi:molybdate transport system substrate-binding protein
MQKSARKQTKSGLRFISMAEVNVLSAGAVKAGLVDAASIFESERSHRVVISFVTAPVLRAQVEAGESQADILVAPVPVLKEFHAKGRVVAQLDAVLGSIKAGVAVRDGARAPDISNASVFREEILASSSLVYNEASSGLYIEKLMEKLGIANEVKYKTRRFPTGGAVMEYLAESKAEAEIGFGQVTEILVYRRKGVVLVGPLPDEIGNVTTYAAGVLGLARTPDVAGEFVRFLSTPIARKCFVATGIL